jgi:nucleotide-binding universal stress UspA family protein
MTDDRPPEPRPGPVLLCAGTEPAAAVGLAGTAAALLADRPAVVLATWTPQPAMGAFDPVVDPLHDTRADLREVAGDAAADAALAACDALQAHDLDATARACTDHGAPWQAILDVADEIEAGVIVAGETERSSEHAGALGSQARALAHRSRRPLLLLPADAVPAEADAPALFAHDGSASADHAAGVAAEIVAAADERDAAIVVVGTRGRARIAAALLGSTAEAVLRHADRPVLLVPPARD